MCPSGDKLHRAVQIQGQEVDFFFFFSKAKLSFLSHCHDFANSLSLGWFSLPYSFFLPLNIYLIFKDKLRTYSFSAAFLGHPNGSGFLL